MNDTIKQTNTLYLALCDLMKEGAGIVAAESGKFIYCNKSLLRLFGLNTLEDLDIYQFRKYRKEELTADGLAERLRIIEEKGFYCELVEYNPGNAEAFFGELCIHAFRNNNADYYLFTVTTVDKAFFELSSLGILMVNRQGAIVTANPSVLKLFGYERAELMGKTIEKLIPARFHKQHIGQRDKYVNQPTDRELGAGRELFALRKDGTEFPVEVSLGHYPSDGDRYVIAFINDITVRKNAEEESKQLHRELESEVTQRTAALRETLRQLEASKAALQKVNLLQKTLLDSAGAIIISVDENGIIETFNPEAEKELGYAAAEVIGKQSPAIFHDPALYNQKLHQLAGELPSANPVDIKVLFTKAAPGKQLDDELTYIRKDGTTFPARLTITPMKDEAGAIKGYVGVAFDISNIKKVEKELKETIQKEKDLNELKSRFVTMASHEFRTPLSTVLSSSYLIEKYAAAEDQPKRTTHLQRIVSAVNMLTDILNDFLSVGKIEEGKIQVRAVHFNIRQLVLEVIDGIEGILKLKQTIQYHHEGAEDVLLDPSLLKHIIMNLTSNASKFSPAGSLIEIYSSCDEKYITVAVRDHGMGITKADQEHLMERFFRGANAGNIQGTGLGLHIVAKYAELMNGIVECKSELENGAEFTVRFNHKLC